MTHRSRPAGLYSLLLLFAVASLASAQDSAAQTTTVSANRMTPIVKAVEATKRSTVNIHSEKRARTADVLFSAGRDKKINGMGTGIIVDERGYIVTNYHVVRDVELLRVTLFDGTAFEARIVSYDSREDLAIIKVDSKEPLPVMPFGTSSDLMLGEDVLAIGNAFGYEHTVTRGIISSLSRDVEVDEEQSYHNLIQIDAAINPGNSGGPLLNGDGEVVGINVAIRAGAQRIGFAIPIDDARLIIARLLNIERLNNHFHGLETIDHKQGRIRKLIVREAEPGSPAEAAGLLPGDVVIKAAGREIVDAADLERVLLGRPTGSQVDLQVSRGDETQTLTLKIANLSADRATPATRSLAGTIPSPPTAAGKKPVDSDKVWRLLGVRTSRVTADDVSLSGHPYRGGMRILEVRPDSPAASNGLQSGDVLVGLHVWETVTPENVTYVLDHPQIATFNPLKFYILRDSDTLYGHFDIGTAAAALSSK
ncbi:MAG: PDZ domain-containing protein [Planctomycetota bacterium]|nr:MAG: PDZ domain-containing protein [Planctomycetota bacterium]